MAQSDQEFYERAIRRVKRNILVLGVTGTLVLAIWKYPRFGCGFLIGGAASYLSFWRWEHIVEAIVTGKTRQPAWRLAIRFLVLMAAGYVIIRLTGFNLAAAAIGLLLPGFAVTIEMIYELISWNTNSG
jgi:hypothetical protein